jgi:hypothetical protein
MVPRTCEDAVAATPFTRHARSVGKPATKTISLELDAYERLRKAKRSERESFSEVVRRARWDDAASPGPQILGRLSELRLRHSDSFLPDDVLDRIGERARTRPARAGVATAKGSRAR